MILVGAPRWDGPALGVEPRCVPDAAAEGVRAALGEAAEGLIVLDARAIGERRPDAVVASLRKLLPGSELLLVHGAIDAAGLIACYRAGLDDAVGGDAPPTAWQELLARAAQRLERRREAGQISLQQLETTRRLRNHRKRLQEELERAGDDLVRSHERLELVNRELSDHMDQLSLLYTFGRELSTARNWDRTLESMLKTLAGFIGAEGAALVLRPSEDAAFAPRQTYRWQDPSWEQVLRRLESESAGPAGAERGLLVLKPLRAGNGAPDVTALPLEHAHQCLGYLLLLGWTPADADRTALPAFLRTVQVILGEEVASAQMLDRIRELGAFNSRVLETVQNGIWVLDETGRTVYCNRTARELLSGRSQETRIVVEPDFGIGRGRAAVDGSATSAFLRRDTFHLDDLPELCRDGLLRLEAGDGALLARLAGRDGEPYRGEGRLVRGSGEAVPVFVQSGTMRGRGRDDHWLVVVLEDLRPARRLAAEKRRADALQGLVEMSATLAHEIRNPLMGLSAQAELLADSIGADDRRRRYLDVITAEVERIESTISRMLNFVRPYTPTFAPADLASLARDCLDLVRPRAEQLGVELTLDAPAAPVRLVADAAQITQVLLNLLLNAVDAAPAGTTVTLAVAGAAVRELPDADTGNVRLVEACLLSVADRGPGFAPEDAERMFRPFFTTKSTGTGLGLSICRKVVEAHRGLIRATRRDGATVFEILLPAGRVGATAREQETS